MTPEEMKTAMYESDAEQTRERIASTVDNLQYRLNPKNMVSGAVGSLQDRGVDLIDNAKQTVREHPMAVSLIALSVGLLLLNRNRIAGRDSYSFDAYEDVYGGDDMNDGYDATADETETRPGMWSRVRDRTSNAKSSVSDRAGSAREFTSEKWQSARERTSDYASRARARASDARYRAAERYDANPLTGALVGLATGALLGLLLPRTSRENQLLGETRDRLADAAKQAARAAADTAKQQLDEKGLNIDAAKAKLAEVGQQAKDVAKTAAQTAASEAKTRAGGDTGTTPGTMSV
jgi:ElaB/YqjD/DUF883 family membrane-anchored ribosome-binding protein